MDEEAQALSAGNGWRIHGTSGEYTFWRRSTALWGKESVGYNVTKGDLPLESRGSYGNLDALAAMKGVRRDAMTLAEGPAADVRAERVPGEDVPSAWRGLYRSGADWIPANDATGEIAFATPEDARAGALAGLEADRTASTGVGPR